jgi:cytochrome c553
MFYPTKGLWFTNQGQEVRAARRRRRLRSRRSRVDRTDLVVARCQKNRGNRQPKKNNPPSARAQFIQMMMKKYEEEPYPTREAMEAIAKEVGAPDWTKIDSFYKNMHVKHCEEYQ